MKDNNIPYKIYLSEAELPKQWYNVRADMKNKPAPLLNPGTLQPMTAEELSHVFCDELVQQELDDTTPYIDIPEEIRDFYKMYRPAPLVRAYCLEKHLGTPAKIPAVQPGDVILFDRLSKYFQTPARGDIVAFSDATGEGMFVGRVVGLPGETVAISGGRVYVGGILLDERAYAMGALPADLAETELPVGCFFILPDDRVDAVVDAGKLTVDASRIRGRAFVRVSPLGRIGLF